MAFTFVRRIQIMNKKMDNELSELEELLSLQESYFDNLIKLGLLFENSGQPEKAFDIYKEGIKKAEKAQLTLSGTMLGLLD